MPIKRKQTTQALVLKFASVTSTPVVFHCSAVEVISNKFNSLSKKNIWY